MPQAGSATLTTGNISYCYKPAMMEGANDLTGNPDSAIVVDAGNNGGASNHTKFGNLLYLDGHVTGVSGDKWYLDNSGYMWTKAPTFSVTSGS